MLRMKPGSRCLALAALLLVVAGFVTPTVGTATAFVPLQLPSAPAIAPAQGPNLTMNISLTPTVIEEGFSAVAMCNGSGGVGPYNAWINYTGSAGSGGTWTNALAGFGLGAPPVGSGNVTYTCTVIDSTGAKASASATLRIIPRPSVPLQGPRTSVVEGAAITLTAAAQGGVAPYRYLWLNLPPGCPYGNVSSVTCTPTAAGTWTVVVGVVDAWGVYDASALTITVEPNPGILALPAGAAALAFGVLAVVAAAGVGWLLVQRRTRRDRTQGAGPTAGPEPEPREDAQAEAVGSARLPRDLSLPESWRALPSFPRRAVSAVALAALGLLFYVETATLASYTPGLDPPGLIFVVYFLGLALAIGSIKVVGPWASLASLVGGIALYYAVAQPLSACTGDLGQAALLGVPPCGALVITALLAAVAVTGVAVAVGVYLLRWSRATRPEQGVIALGALLLALLVAGSAVALTAPPNVPPGAGPAQLSFPIPAGSAFAVPLWVSNASGIGPFFGFQPQAFVPVSFAGSAPAVLVGGWNSSASICVYVGNANFGFLLPPPMKSFGECGTNVTFAFHLAPAVWVVRFYSEIPTGSTIAVTITQSVELVY